MVSNDVLLELICVTSDMTATIFLFIFVIYRLLYIAGTEPGFRISDINDIIGAVLLTAGINCHILGEASSRSDSAEEEVFYILAFILIFLSIDRFFIQIIELADLKSPYRTKGVIIVLAVLSGVGAYLVSGYQPIMTIITFAELIAGTICSMKMKSAVINRGVLIASISVPVICMTVYLLHTQIRIVGLGLAVMFLIGNHTLDIRRIRAESEILHKPDAEGADAGLLSDQMTAHFMFNTLQVIERMCRNDPDKAAEALNSFSQYLRANLENLTSAELIPFADEIRHTRTYVELVQMARGQDAASIEYRLGVTDFEIPALTLQPLVENALVHGTGPDGCSIVITTEERDDAVVLTVENGCRNNSIDADDADAGSKDTGKGSGITVASSNDKHKSVGLENVRARLARLCNGTLDLKIEDERTKAIMRIPR